MMGEYDILTLTQRHRPLQVQKESAGYAAGLVTVAIVIQSQHEYA